MTQTALTSSDLPYLIDRVKAAFVDLVVLILLMWAASRAFEAMGYAGGEWRLAAIAVVFLYEPLLVATGGTLGHRAQKLRVRRLSDPSRNIGLGVSLLRYIVKVPLGVISFLTVSSDPLKRAMHDKSAGSVVIYAP